MTAFTGTGGGKGVPDPLRGDNPHAVISRRFKGAWSAWCNCRPGRIADGHTSAAKAVAAVVAAHGPGDGVGTFPLTLSRRQDAYAWQIACRCSWSALNSKSGGACEAGVVHWNKSHAPRKTTALDRSGATGGKDGRTIQVVVRERFGFSIGHVDGLNSNPTWVHLGSVGLNCSDTCVRELSLLRREQSGELAVVCRLCRDLWPASIYDDATRQKFEAVSRRKSRQTPKGS